MRSKILMTAVISATLSSMLYASSVGDKSIEFVKNVFNKDRGIVKIEDIKLVSSSKIKNGWEMDVIKAKVLAVDKKEHTPTITVFTDGHYFTELAYDSKGNPIFNDIKIDTKKLYNNSALIYEPKDKTKIKKRVAVFSDTECPYCNLNGYKVLDKLKKSKDTAIYYYHFPLEEIHPNSKNYSLCIIAASKKYPNKKFEIIEKIYKDKAFQYKQGEKARDLKDIVKEFNKEVPFAKITLDDIKKYKANDELQKEFQYGLSIGVMGTPTVIVNGKKVREIN